MAEDAFAVKRKPIYYKILIEKNKLNLNVTKKF